MESSVLQVPTLMSPFDSPDKYFVSCLLGTEIEKWNCLHVLESDSYAGGDWW